MSQFDRYAFIAHLLEVQSEQDLDDVLRPAADHVWDSMQAVGRPDAYDESERSAWEVVHDLSVVLLHGVGTLR
jgi:hypothetical protein